MTHTCHDRACGCANDMCRRGTTTFNCPECQPKEKKTMNIERLESIRASGNVVRFHTVPLQRTQNVAQHSYGVVMILLEIEPDIDAQVIRAALLHDYPELFTGDMPSTTKWSYPELEAALKKVEADILDSINYPELTPKERWLIKIADLLEGAMFCVEEVERGSQFAGTICRRFLEACAKRDIQKNISAAILHKRLWDRLTLADPTP